MDVKFEAAEVPPKTPAARKHATAILHPGDIGLSAESMQRGRMVPGTYVALVERDDPSERVWFRRVCLLPSTESLQSQTSDENALPIAYGALPPLVHDFPAQMHLHPIPNHMIPTIEYIHLEWVKPSTSFPSHHEPSPSLPLLPMLVGGIFEHNMVWHCVWHGIDYGTWRCHLGGDFASHNSADDSKTAAPPSYAPFLRHRKLGVVGKHTQLTVSHPSSSSFRLEASPSSTEASFVPHASATALADLATQALTRPEPSLCRILMHGPMGSGKAAAVRHLAHSHNATLLQVDATILALQSPVLSSLERPFLACFTAALHMQPAVVCIKHIERLFPKALDGPAATRIADFCNALNTLQLQPARVAVVATAVDMTKLFPRVRQCFQDEIDMELTALPFRQRLLRSLFPLAPMPPPSAIPPINAVLMQHGQQPGDVITYMRHAIASAVAATDGTCHATLSPVDLILASRVDIHKSTTASVTLPNVSWSEIGGADNVKQTLQEMVVWPFEKPEVFARMGITPPIGLLLYGPPGTGKTMLAKAAATATMCNFINVTASDLISSEFGDSEKAVARVFQTARAMSPCIVFLDEFQSMFAARSSSGQMGSRMASQLLQEIDALRALRKSSEQYVFVLAATNCVDAIDDAFLQPGRFEHVVHVGHPDAAGRRQILDLVRSQMPWDEDVDVDDLVADTDGLSAAEVVSVTRTAGLVALASGSEARVSMDHLRQALITTLERYHVDK